MAEGSPSSKPGSPRAVPEWSSADVRRSLMLAQFGQEAEGASSRWPGIEKPPSNVATAAPPVMKDWYGSNASRSRDATPEGNPTGPPGAALERVRQSHSKEGTHSTTPGTSPGTTPLSTPLTTPLSTPGGTLERHWSTKDGTTEDPSPARKSDEARGPLQPAELAVREASSWKLRRQWLRRRKRSPGRSAVCQRAPGRRMLQAPRASRRRTRPRHQWPQNRRGQRRQHHLTPLPQRGMHRCPFLLLAHA